MIDLIARLFRKAAEQELETYTWENTGYGFKFSLPEGEKPVFEDSLPAYQHTLLQQLLEGGDARTTHDRREFHIDADVLCRLDENARDILALPAPWPGSMELEVQGTTSRPGFSLSLVLRPPVGMRRVSYCLEGPLICADCEHYLPDAAQWLALHAVQKHTAVAPSLRTEVENLRAVYALQQAHEAGLNIDLRRFAKIEVTVPSSVGVSVIESADGSLRLVPDFRDGSSPEEIEARLGQLGENTGAIRVGSRIMLLDDRRLAAVREILSSRVISRKEKHRFFKSPTAYLDASLVDLDMGFSLRMHGMEEFRKAYFGQTEPSDILWFGDERQKTDIISLSSCGPLLSSEEDIETLEIGVQTALREGQSFTELRETTILLPESTDQTKAVLQNLKENFGKRYQTHPENECEEKGPAVQISVSIDLHDEDQPDQREVLTDLSLYTGELYEDTLRYTFKPYQEQGTRWVLGLMDLMGTGASGHRGGLLADDMGLGKTFMVLAALNVYYRIARSEGCDKPVLAVMPVILLENWVQEINRVFSMSPFRDIVVLQAGRDLRRFRREGVSRESVARGEDDMPSLSEMRYALKVGSAFGSERLDLPGRIVLVNYDTLRDYQFSFSLVDWGCVIFDEAQEMRNPNALKSRAAKALKSDFCLAVTGTPLENSLTDFWSLFDTVLPGLLGSFQQFNRTYEVPVRNASQENKDAVKQQIGRSLRDRVGPYMLRRTKEDNLTGLPRKIIHDGSVEQQYSAIMTGRQLERYDSVVASVAAARNSQDRGRIRETLFPNLRKLQNVSLHPALLEGAPRVCSGRKEAEAVLRESAKLALLLDILQEIRDRGEKVIIFVINKNLQMFLSYALGLIYGLEISVVNGDTKSVTLASGRGQVSRIELIRAFEAKEGFQIICMSPLAAGVGITVTGANNVIHLERHWNPAREAQATDRVYRIGATRDVHVYLPLLLHPKLKSFDVNLNELLRRKTDLKDAVVTESNIQSTEFDSNEMFGTDVVSGTVGPDWLDSMGWDYFEALVGAVARRLFGGVVYLTARSGDHGADVIILAEKCGIAIQCKSSRRPFRESDAACQPFTACREYGQRFGKPFETAILAVNAPSVESNVRDRARDLQVTVWDKTFFVKQLREEPIPFTELELLLQTPRMEL